jgi:hypothetical protein
MSAMNTRTFTLAERGLIGLAGVLFCAGAAQAANATIYKCFDKHLALVYTDVPCKDGEQLDLRAGDADPAAVARLDRERELLSLAAAQRIVDERNAALQRDLADRSRPVMVEPNAPDASADYGYGYGYPVLAYTPKARPHRQRTSRSSELHRFAPPPPYPVPRP